MSNNLLQYCLYFVPCLGFRSAEPFQVFRWYNGTRCGCNVIFYSLSILRVVCVVLVVVVLVCAYKALIGGGVDPSVAVDCAVTAGWMVVVVQRYTVGWFVRRVGGTSTLLAVTKK